MPSPLMNRFRNKFEGTLESLSQFETREAQSLMTEALEAMDTMNNAIILQNEVCNQLCAACMSRILCWSCGQCNIGHAAVNYVCCAVMAHHLHWWLKQLLKEKRSHANGTSTCKRQLHLQVLVTTCVYKLNISYTCLMQLLLGLSYYCNMQPMQLALYVFGVACQSDAYLMHICLLGIHVWWSYMSSATC